MTVKYSINRMDLNIENYKAGTRSCKGQRSATSDYTLLRPILLKLKTPTKNDL